MQDFLRDEFFVKFVMNPDEDTAHYWQSWLEKYPEKRKDFELAKQVLQSIKYKDTKKLSESDYNHIFLNIREFSKQHGEAESDKTSNIKSRHFHKILQFAAVILFLISLSYGIIYMIPEDKYDNLTAYEELVEINVPHGAKRTIRFADGSVIRLNAGSQLIFPKHFNSDVRKVELKGEAYFDVARDENRPFTIKSGNINTHVLGTSFNLKNYAHENVIEVALVSGEVKVIDGHGNETFLKPLDAAVYSRDTQTITKQSFDVRLVTSWKDNILVFEYEPFGKVVERLESWYGVEVILELKKPIEGSYKGEYNNESLETVLEGIGTVHKFEHKISADGKKVIIKN